MATLEEFDKAARDGIAKAKAKGSKCMNCGKKIEWGDSFCGGPCANKWIGWDTNWDGKN